MTKLFEQAIARLRQLPETIQDRAARALMLQLEEEPEPWPAPGSEDTELGVLMEPEVDHGETEVYAGVQA
jgi:hypothetical protein